MTLWNLFSCFVSFLSDFIAGELRCDSTIPIMDESSSDSVCETCWTYEFQKTNPALLFIRPKSIVSRMIKDAIGFPILPGRGLKKNLRNVSTFMNLKFKHHYTVDKFKIWKICTWTLEACKYPELLLSQDMLVTSLSTALLLRRTPTVIVAEALLPSSCASSEFSVWPRLRNYVSESCNEGEIAPILLEDLDWDRVILTAPLISFIIFNRFVVYGQGNARL